MIKKKILFILFSLFFSTSLFANEIIDSIISKNKLNQDKVKTFQSEIEFSAVYGKQSLLQKGNIYFKKEPVKKLKIAYYSPSEDISIYENEKKVYEKKMGIVKMQEEIDEKESPGTGGSMSADMSINFSKDILNYTITSIKSNTNDYAIIGTAKDSDNTTRKKVFIVNKTSGLLMKSIEYDKDNIQKLTSFVKYEKIDDIWIFTKIKNDVFVYDLKIKMPYTVQFKNIQLNKLISDDIFEY